MEKYSFAVKKYSFFLFDVNMYKFDNCLNTTSVADVSRLSPGGGQVAVVGGVVGRGWRRRRRSGSGRVRERVVVRAPGRQRGSAVRGSVRVRERVVVSASGQAAEAARKSRDKIRLG